MNIPPLYQDEHVLGWRGKIRLINHYPTTTKTQSILREHYIHRARSNQQVSTKVSELLILAHTSGLSSREFAKKHTFLGFVKIFGTNAFDDDDESQRTPSKLRYWAHAGKTESWHCIECAQDDMEKHRLPYWRRSHNLIGVDYCYIHGGKLVSKDLKLDFDGLPSAELNHVVTLDGPKSIKNTEPIIQRYVAIALFMLHLDGFLDFSLFVSLLRLRFSEMFNFQLSRIHLPFKDFEHAFPAYWSKQFRNLRTKIQGNDIFNFENLLNKENTPLDTERYILALAFLYKDIELAISDIRRFALIGGQKICA